MTLLSIFNYFGDNISVRKFGVNSLDMIKGSQKHRGAWLGH
jgi:hypothetical protein